MTCYKAYLKKLVPNLQKSGFDIEIDMAASIFTKTKKYKEIPITYFPRKKGKKIGKLDGVKSLLYLISAKKNYSKQIRKKIKKIREKK